MAEDRDRAIARVLEAARAHGVRQVRVIFLDYNGIARARSVMADRLGEVMRHGVNFSSPTVEFDSRDVFPPGAAFDLASPDFWALPDPATFRPAPPGKDTGEMLAHLVDARGEPWRGCPRAALRRVVRRAEAAGLRFNIGFEPEGYVFRPSSAEPDASTGFAGAPGFATLDGLDLERAFMLNLLAYLREAGIEVEQWSEEYGPGQIEVNLRYGTAMASADGLTTYKHAFRAIARASGLIGTFMPKPFGDQAGSGLHVHLSASPPDVPVMNLFDDPRDTDLGLSTVGRQVLAGILAHGPALTALGASTVNSYKRFLPGSWAPTHVVHAYASRAAFVRIPERETARRLELRAGDPAGNPHIFLTGILAAALDGIRRELDPGPPSPGDVAAHPPSGAVPVPPTLEAALDALEADEVMHGALGPIIFEEFIRIKRFEWQQFAMHVGAWDRDMYLHRY